MFKVEFLVIDVFRAEFDIFGVEFQLFDIFRVEFKLLDMFRVMFELLICLEMSFRIKWVEFKIALKILKDMFMTFNIWIKVDRVDYKLCCC